MRLFEAAKKWLSEASPLARAVLLVAVLGGLAGLAISFAPRSMGASKPLFTRLSPTDASEVLEVLRQRKIPYEVSAGGDTILVPADQVHELRLDLAGSGLPRGGGVGFELFDQNSVLMTDFTQRVNYTRAM